jgi:hypothetical protein
MSLCCENGEALGFIRTMNFLDDVNNCQLLEELVYFLHSNIYSLLQNSAQSEEYFSCCTCSGTFLQILIF